MQVWKSGQRYNIQDINITPPDAVLAVICHCTKWYHYLTRWQREFWKAIENMPSWHPHHSLSEIILRVPSLPLTKIPSFAHHHLNTSSHVAELTPPAVLPIYAPTNVLVAALFCRLQIHKEVLTAPIVWLLGWGFWSLHCCPVSYDEDTSPFTECPVRRNDPRTP